MKTTGVSGIPKFGLLDFLGHPNGEAKTLSFTDWRMLWILVRNRRSPGNKSDSKIL